MKQNKTFSLFLFTVLLGSGFFVFGLFSLDRADAAAAAISPAQGKVGESFTLTGSAGQFSLFNNTVEYYSSDGGLLLKQTGIYRGSSSFSGDGSLFTSTFPLFLPGSYSLKVISDSGVVTENISFSIVSGGEEPKIGFLVGVSGLTQIPEMSEALQDEFGFTADRVAVIILDSGFEGSDSLIGADYEVFFNGIESQVLAEEGGSIITAIPSEVSGVTAVRVRINNSYETPAFSLDFGAAGQHRLTAPNGGEIWRAGNVEQVSWTGGKKALAVLLPQEAGELMFEDFIILSDKDTTASPFSWQIPDTIKYGDYRIGLLIYDGPSLEELEDYFENYSSASPPLGLFVHISISQNAFLIKDSSHPAGTLVRDDNGAVYEITADGRVGFPTVGVFRSHGHRFEEVVEASDADRALPEIGLKRFSDGDLIVDGGTVYIIFQGRKYAFSSREAFEGQGYRFENVFPGDLSGYELGGVISGANEAHRYGSLVNIDGAVYLVTPEGRRPITSAEAFRSNKFRFGRVVAANAADRALPVQAPVDFAPGTLINVNGTIYLITPEGRKGFGDADTFHHLGYRFENALPVRDDQVRHLPERQAYRGAPKGVLSEARSLSRDAKRLADVRQMQTALELYYNDYRQYPASLAELSPNYISAIPTAPQPPDGSCSDSNNDYLYLRGGDVQDYSLIFCLGSATGGLEGGEHSAHPAGIRGAFTQNNGLSARLGEILGKLR